MGDVEQRFNDGVPEDDVVNHTVAAAGTEAIGEGDLGLDAAPGGGDVLSSDIEASFCFLLLRFLVLTLGDWFFSLT